MMASVSALLVLLGAAVVTCVGDGSPLFKVFFQTTPLYRGRADPIVQPGNIPSNHVHRVVGGNNFQSYPTSQWNSTSVYNNMLNSSCTTGSITVDKSAYWTPDLYYQDLNGSLSLVPVAQTTIYYIGRTGSTKSLPNYAKWTAFPPGFRMVAGNPFVRNYTGTIPASAASWSCYDGGPETNYLPTANRTCGQLRAQIFFPMCWDGVNVDSPSHTAHVAYPVSIYNSGDCPSTHPVRIPAIFIEVLYTTAPFPHGNGRQPFVLACGDPTGYGMHGDFLNGWNVNILQNALNDVSCYANNTNNGNDVAACNTLAPYLKANNPDESCKLANPIANYEDIGFARPISHLPGCDNITVINITNSAAVVRGSPIPGGIYAGVSKPVISGNAWRVLIKSSSGLYVTSVGVNGYLTASVNTSVSNTLTYNNVFVFAPTGTANTYSIQSEYDGQYVTASGSPLQAARGNVQSWETFVVTLQAGATSPTAAGATASIVANFNSKYVVVDPTNSNSLIATGPSAGSAITQSATFLLIDANANQVQTCVWP